MQVPFTDAASLRASSRGVIEGRGERVFLFLLWFEVGFASKIGMLEADPNAVWLMQGWLFLFSRFWHPDR